MADRIFDFNKTEDSNISQNGSVTDGSLVTWKIVERDDKELSADCPIMILSEEKEKLPKHVAGVFVNPVRGTSFAYTEGKVEADVSGKDKDGRDLNHHILKIDKRFIDLEKWLGENHVSVRLSDESREEGYCVYKIRAVTPDG
jgi:ATP-dependent Lon protease